jgi:hypothetical protein
MQSSVLFCWQAEAETVAEDSDDDTKEDGRLEHPSNMPITEGDVRMQRIREQKHASTI